VPCLARLVTLALALFSVAAAPPARARVESGQVLPSIELPTLSGGREPLTAATGANVIVFWRPGQDHSIDTLRQMAQCQKVLAGKAVHLVAVVSSTYPREAVKAAIAEGGFPLPVLLDVDDNLYGQLEIRQHPMVVVADGKGRIALAQPYVRLRLCAIVQGHVRLLLREIDQAQLEAILNPARASMPDDDQRNVARRFVRMGGLDAESGHCDRALTSFRKALEISPGDPEALAGIARCDPARSPSARR
jgi:peroxiredoxin